MRPAIGANNLSTNPRFSDRQRGTAAARTMQAVHGKETEENAAAADGGAPPPLAATAPAATTTTTVATTTTATTAAATEPPALSQSEYEASFELADPSKTAPAAGSFGAFSDPDRFHLASIYASAHYVVDALAGEAYFDSNGDGMRGSVVDATLNALERDTMVGGVKVSLVDCANDRIVDATGTLPGSVGVGTQMKKTLLDAAGSYDFGTLGNVAEGRYYLLFRAPRDHRLTGNALPQEYEATAGGAVVNCLPSGGEGQAFLDRAYEIGDLDQNGYCARTVGCLEVGSKSRLRAAFANLIGIERHQKEHPDLTETLVALPTPDFLEVGAAEESWPLAAYQHADSEITLEFASTVQEGALAAGVPEDFARSDVKRRLEASLARLFAEGDIGGFGIEGVEVREGEIESPSSSRRGLRGDPAAGGKRHRQPPRIKYKLTARGAHRPPPYEQLGALLEESINADPRGAVRSLKDREAGLPPVFEEVAAVDARHLTVKKEPVKAPVARVEESKMATWAVVPMVLLALLIMGLVGALLIRRMFVRRRRVEDMDPYKLGLYVKEGGLAVASKCPEGNKKKKRRTRRDVRSNRELAASSMVGSLSQEELEALENEVGEEGSSSRRSRLAASVHSALSSLRGSDLSNEAEAAAVRLAAEFPSARGSRRPAGTSRSVVAARSGESRDSLRGARSEGHGRNRRRAQSARAGASRRGRGSSRRLAQSVPIVGDGGPDALESEPRRQRWRKKKKRTEGGRSERTSQSLREGPSSARSNRPRQAQSMVANPY